ncbi:MAG TPA: hypothetical protein VMF11_02255 [Candidatus Baltobacteraceae bacterium]|nr:hypothetical protein [Candidatus Baltobacteraceae bacterium]
MIGVTAGRLTAIGDLRNAQFPQHRRTPANVIAVRMRHRDSGRRVI